MRATARFLLDGHTPMPAPDIEAWEDWMETTDRRALVSELHQARPPMRVIVETHFTGWDYLTPDGAGPMFFMTLVVPHFVALPAARSSPPWWTLHPRRYARDWDAATLMHQAMCATLWGQGVAA